MIQLRHIEVSLSHWMMEHCNIKDLHNHSRTYNNNLNEDINCKEFACGKMVLKPLLKHQTDKLIEVNSSIQFCADPCKPCGIVNPFIKSIL